MAPLERLNSPLECLRAPFLFNSVIRGSNKIVYEDNEERTCLLHSVTKVLGLSADYDPFRTIKMLDHPAALFSVAGSDINLSDTYDGNEFQFDMLWLSVFSKSLDHANMPIFKNSSEYLVIIFEKIFSKIRYK